MVSSMVFTCVVLSRWLIVDGVRITFFMFWSPIGL